MGRERRIRGFLPQANGDARGLASSAACALGSGGSAGALGDEAGESGAAVVARPASKAAVHHDTNVVECQAGLGDRGRKHQLAGSRLRLGKRRALLRRLDCAVKAVQDDVRRQLAQRFGCPLDFGDSGQEREQRTIMLV
jgi:hypothetical protein